MTALEKFPESEYLIRFPDCDPFNHLNNSRYLDYFMNAREDHLLKYYNFSLYGYMREQGRGWVVGQSQIAYLRPAMLMETVVIRSFLIKLDEKDLLVEMQMLDQKKETVKAVLWSRFFHIDVKTQKSAQHDPELIAMFKSLEVPLEGNPSFEERARLLRMK